MSEKVRFERRDGRVFLLGVTGGIGSGKSSVSAILARCGAHVLDADRIVRELYDAGGELVDRIAERFGAAMRASDGTVDRETLGRVVFASPESRLALEALVHPAVREVAMNRLEALQDDREAALAVLDAALLAEADPPYPLDALLVVTAPLDVRLARLRDRGLPEPEARRRMAAQISDADRVARADVVVENAGSLRDLEREVLAVLADLGFRLSRGS